MEQVTVQPSAGEFKNGLLSCCGSCVDCSLAYLCAPCYAFCTAQAAGEGMLNSILNALCYPLCLCCLRSSVREKRGIEGSCLGDLAVTMCCPCCGYVQVKREFQ